MYWVRGLQTNRAFYAEVEGDDWVVEGGYAQGVALLPPGRYAADTYGRRIMEIYRAGKRMVLNDVRNDAGFKSEEREAHVAINIVAAVGVPLVKEGKLAAILTVHSAGPRNWTEQDMNSSRTRLSAPGRQSNVLAPRRRSDKVRSG